MRTAIAVHLVFRALPVKSRKRVRSGSTLHRHQVDRRILASSVDLDIEFDSVSLVEAGQPRTFNRADVNKSVWLAVITRDEAKALHRIEELDRAGRLLASQLSLRRSLAFLHGDGLADNLEIASGNLAATVDQLEFQLLTFGQTVEPGAFDRADVHEHIFTAIIALNEAETLARIEEFHDALALPDDLGWHAATPSTAGKSAATAARAAATAAETVATASAKPVLAAHAALLSAEEWIELVFTEPITLVASPTATTSVKTHL